MKLIGRNYRPSLRKLCSADTEILRTLAVNRFASSAEILARLTGVSEQYNLRRRVRYLRKLKLIEPLIGDGGNRLGFRLTARGVHFATEMEFTKADVDLSRPHFRSQFDHDQIVNEVRGILSCSPIIHDFRSEIELRSQSGIARAANAREQEHEWKVPDAMFSLRTVDGVRSVALEVELTQKAKARYSKIFAALVTSRQFHFVFIVCKDEKLMTTVRNALNDTRATNVMVRVSNRRNGIYFCTLDSLRAGRLDATWRGEETAFTLSELASRIDVNL